MERPLGLNRSAAVYHCPSCKGVIRRADASYSVNTDLYSVRPSLRASSMSKGILQMATGRGATVAVTLLSAPVLGRLFPPAAYGAVTVLTTIGGFLGAFATFSYVQALPLAANASERRALFVLCVGVVGTTSALVAIATAVVREDLAAAFHEPQVAQYAWFLPVLFAASAVKTLLDMTLSCERLFSAVSLRAVVEVLITRLSQMGLCMVGFAGSPLGLFLGSMAGTWIAALMSGVTSARRVLGEGERRFEWQQLWEVALKHRQFPLVFLWIQTLNTVALGLPQMMLGLRFTLADVAYYGMGSMMVGLPLSLFASSSSQVFYVEAAGLVARGQSAARTTQQLIRVLNTLIPFPLTVVAALAPMLFETFLGSRWQEAGVFAQILVPWMVLMAYASPLSSAYSIFGRQSEMFALNVVLLALRFCALYYGGLWFGIRTTLALFTLAGVLVNFWSVVRTTRMLGVPWWWCSEDTILAYATSLALLLPAAALYWCVGSTLGSLLALAGACGLQVVLLCRRHPNVVQRFLPGQLRQRAG